MKSQINPTNFYWNLLTFNEKWFKYIMANYKPCDKQKEIKPE